MPYIEVVGVILFGIAGICSVFAHRRRLFDIPATKVMPAPKPSPACLEPDLRGLATAIDMADKLEREPTSAPQPVDR